MKASEHGGNVPPMIGEVAYSQYEDGDNDGVWPNVAASEFSAIEELSEHDDNPDGDGDDIIGYLGDLAEVDTPEIDMGDLLSNLNDQACDDMNPALVGNWPKATREQLAELNAEANAVIAKWLTRHKLWPMWCGIENIRPVLRKQAREQARDQ